MVPYLTFIGLVLLAAQEAFGSEMARGFNDDIDWVSLNDGLKLAKEQNKPMMILIHKSWCGSCKSLKPKFSASQEIFQMSKDFVMVNIMDEEENNIGRAYSPDGAKYIPRILFADANGKIDLEIYNVNGNDKYKFYYYEPSQITASMRTALDSLGSIVSQREGGEL